MSENPISKSPPTTESINGSVHTGNIEEMLKNSENGLQTITEFASTARTAAVATQQFQELAAKAHSEAQAKLAEVTTVATQVVGVMTQISDGQAVIANKSDHIQKAQEHADKIRAELDRALTSATQQTTEAEGLKSRSQSAADNASKLLTDIRTAKGAIDTDAAIIVTARKAAEESAAQTKVLAEKSTIVEERIEGYEKRLAELETQCNAQLKTILDLLPGATTAGLAEAFDRRGKTFLAPHTRWQWIFVTSLGFIVILAVTGLWHVYKSATAPSYDELFRLWLSRLPVAGALVWLAMHASRESALAKRLEEDYGYKAAIASSFLGFQKKLSEIGTSVASDSQLAKLCENTLTTIATPPGRIYEKHELTVSPSDELKQAAKALIDASTALKTAAK